MPAKEPPFIKYMRSSSFLFFLVGGFFVSLFNGCDGIDSTAPEDIYIPTENVSFQVHVQPFLEVSCNSLGCRDAPRSDNRFVSLRSYFEVMSINVVNAPGDTNCGLVRVLFEQQQNHVPVRGSIQQREGIKQWVKEGAKNN